MALVLLVVGTYAFALDGFRFENQDDDIDSWPLGALCFLLVLMSIPTAARTLKPGISAARIVVILLGATAVAVAWAVLLLTGD